MAVAATMALSLTAQLNKLSLSSSKQVRAEATSSGPNARAWVVWLAPPTCTPHCQPAAAAGRFRGAAGHNAARRLAAGRRRSEADPPPPPCLWPSLPAAASAHNLVHDLLQTLKSFEGFKAVQAAAPAARAVQASHADGNPWG